MLSEKLIKIAKEMNGKCAFVIKDLKDGETFAYMEKTIVPSASLIKMFILITAFRHIERGEISLDTTIAVRAKDIVPFSVLTFLKPREYCLEELLKLMVVYSDNTATNVLVDFFGLEAINGTMEFLGCKDSVMQRKMMDFAAADEGRQNYTTAADMAEILIRLYDDKILGNEFDRQMLSIMKGQADEEMMRRLLPDEITIARKSGELDALDHDIAIVYTEQRDYVYVFFSWDAGDNNNAREILAKTSKEVFDYFMAK